MQRMSPISMAVNAAGAAAVLIVGGYAASSMFAKDETVNCTKRYPSATQLSFVNDVGEPMSPIELQGRFGREEWGVLENVGIVPGKTKGSEVMQVNLPAGTSSAYQIGSPKGGAGFMWSPGSIENATSACLSYRVLLPKDFEFADSGLLPGLFGGDKLIPGEDAKSKTGFSTRLAWRRDGTAGIAALSPAADANDMRQLYRGAFKLPRGRWLQVDSEVALNAPGKADGILRLWIDNELKLEHTNVVLRSTEDLKVSGVVADISYGSFGDGAPAPKDALVQLSPFALSWR